MTTPTHTHTTTGPTTSATAKTYTAAMIGCGSAQRQGSKLAGGFGIGYAHAQGYAGCPRTELVAAADINAENLTAYGEQFQLDPARRFADYEQMIAEVQPDIVSIGTYVGLHYPMMEKAAKAGVKGILCEKPFVRSPKELAAVQRLVDETGVKICIAHQRRNSGVFQRAAELYNDGTVGQRLCCIAATSRWRG